MAITIDHTQISDVELDGIDTKDAPDFCDAFVLSATYMGRPMTEEELDAIDSEFIHEEVQKQLY